MLKFAGHEAPLEETKNWYGTVEGRSEEAGDHPLGI